ncbi:MAG: hypothetical protein OEO23_11515, partial [Gemmatimonadota bacterium]|nr:hypothetical protein [Gemmatimonadota bacterium]
MLCLTCLGLALAAPVAGQRRTGLPLRQDGGVGEQSQRPLTLRDASRDDRWLGVPVKDVRWAPDASVVYFRWHEDPTPEDVEADDPWFRAAADGSWAELLDDSLIYQVPGPVVSWSRSRRRAAWAKDGTLYVYSAGESPSIRAVVSLGEPLSDVVVRDGDDAVDFRLGTALLEYRMGTGRLRTLARQGDPPAGEEPPSRRWIQEEQERLFPRVVQRRRAAEEAGGAADPEVIGLPVPPGATLD